MLVISFFFYYMTHYLSTDYCAQIMNQLLYSPSESHRADC